MTGSTQHIWFGTPVWQRRLDISDEERLALAEEIRRRAARDPSLERSSVGGWHSPQNLHQDEMFQGLLAKLGAFIGDAATSLRVDLPRAKLAITEMWACYNPPDALNRSHIHPWSVFSGVYYLQVPTGSGNIEFADPIAARVMAPLPVTKMTPMNSDTAQLAPTDGLAVLFPSWLSHAVGPNRSEEARIVVSFNVRRTNFS